MHLFTLLTVLVGISISLINLYRLDKKKIFAQRDVSFFTSLRDLLPKDIGADEYIFYKVLV